MLRLFLPLYLILTVFFIGFIFAVQTLPDILLEERIASFDDRVTRGTFHLIDQRLKSRSPNAHQAEIHSIHEHFGYPVLLLDEADPLITDADWETVLTGKLLQAVIDEADYYVRQLPETGRVVAFTFADTKSEVDHREAQGTFYLIEQFLRSQPVAEWPEMLDTLQPHFGIPIELIHTASVNFDDEKKRALFDQGNIVAFDHDTNAYRFFGKISDSPYTLFVGPINVPVSELTWMISVLAALVIFLAIALMLWVRPVWRAVRDLSRTADQFGQGDLHARSQIKPSAILGRLASQFNQMADRIGQLIIGHRELTNAVSHELRTPIARMRFAIDMLENTDNVDDRSRYLLSMHTDINDLESMVDELLTYARFERTDAMQEFEPVPLITWLEALCENARGYAGSIEIRLNNTQKMEHDQAMLNARYFARALHNLLRNGVRFARSQMQLTLELTTDKKQFRLYVDDDGPGIPIEDRETVFQAFSRLDKSRDRQSGGHGLGLAITQRIVHAHHGTIRIEDSPLGGARFTLCWPITPTH